MAKIKFLNLDTVNRLVEFEVRDDQDNLVRLPGIVIVAGNKTRTNTADGVSSDTVSRVIPDKFAGTIDDYIFALAKGLKEEADLAVKQQTEIGETSYIANQEL